ncbi:hypothetical protein MRB53_010821 [Persea americana]|uniref:Uncharacterized protein n=1 Tax=Persea americana TaxID=3435 RepID=A0ACC2LU37_PERAE|nr:hypothetical protein MRB53_010821 [Persea americana]
MISFFKSLLGFSDSRHFPQPSGLRLIAAGDLHTPPHVLPSPAVKPAGNPPEQKNDPDPNLWLGLYDFDGLRSCTESLGFESSDEWGSKEGEEEILMIRSRPVRKARERKPPPERAELPPPLPSLNRKGERSFFLRPEKKNGRLLLTEVKKIERPEILRSSRQDGRLRLEFIRKPDELEHEHEVPNEQEDKGKEPGEDLTVHRWPLQFGRCQDLRYHHHHNHDRLSYLSQRCVTST